MKQPKLHSIIHGLLEKLNNEQNFEAAQEACIIYIQASQINDMDKRKMVMIITYQIHTTKKLYEYLYNSLLKYEGLGTFGRKD